METDSFRGSEEWLRKLNSVVDRSGEFGGALYALEQAKLQAANTVKLLEKAETNLKERVETLHKQLVEVLGMREDPVVLTRSYGRVEVYHSSRRPCGHVGDPNSTRRMLRGDALKNHLRPCDRCGWAL